MIDLHSHILPALDDGATSVAMSLEMARTAVADGITHMACTPHIMPGVYDNDMRTITRAVDALTQELLINDIDLGLSVGADIHVAPDLVQRLAGNLAPTIAGSRYFLLEPPHHVRPPGLAQLVERLVSRGYVPVITHPERLAWIEYHYNTICALEAAGAVMQLTAGSITGGFGRRARYWSDRMLDEGRVTIIATDAHHPRRRPPILSKARDAIAQRLGDEAAVRMTVENPAAIVADAPLPGALLEEKTEIR